MPANYMPVVAAAQEPKPKVVVIGPTPPPYHGMSVYTHMLLQAPRLQSEYSVLHVETADRRSMDNMGRLDFMNVVLALRHTLQLAGMIVRERPDLVYVEVSQNAWAYLRDAFLIAVARIGGARVVTHLLGSDFRDFYHRSGSICRWIVRTSSRWVHAAAVMSPSLTPIYDGLVPSERVHVARAGLPDAFSDAAASADARRQRIHVLHIGMLFRRKGVIDLLEAVARLKSEGVLERVTIAGEWVSSVERELAEELVSREGLEEIVRFAGVVDDARKHALFLEADVLVFPGYQTEGLPLVILEAMAAGIPVVSTRMGAIPDAVRDRKEGLLIAAREPAAIAAALRQLALDPAQRAAMGRAGRERFLQHYTHDRCVAQLISVFDDARAA
jgi:glycosyltransferase involved in cell wall biosynthesis